MGLLRRLLGRPETRTTGYTDLLLSASLARAGGRAVQAASLGAVETASSIVGRCMATAEVAGDMGVLTPFILGEMARDMLRRGETLWRFDAPPARLARGTWWDVHGTSPHQSDWRYRLSVVTPDSTESQMLGADQVAHVRYSSTPEQPWYGVAPLARASLLAELAGRLSVALGDEAGTLAALIVAVPNGTDDATIKKLRAQLEAPGRIALMESTSGGFSDGVSAAPRYSDWRPERLGPKFTDSEIELRKLITNEVLSCLGVPAALADPASAAASLREAQRMLLLQTVAPLSKLIAGETSRVLEQEVRITFHSLAAADVTARARAIKAMREAEIPLDEAKELVGW